MDKELSEFSERVMAKRGVELITPFDMKVKTRALEKEGRSIIHLEIGEPNFDTPENINFYSLLLRVN